MVIIKFVFSYYEDKIVVVVLIVDKCVLFSSFVGEENMFIGEVEWVVECIEFDIEGCVDELLILFDIMCIFICFVN